MRVRLYIDVIAAEPARAILAGLLVEQPVVQVRIFGPVAVELTGRFVGATGAEGDPE